MSGADFFLRGFGARGGSNHLDDLRVGRCFHLAQRRQRPADGHKGCARHEQLLVAGAPFVTVSGNLPIIRETEAPPNPQVVEMIAAGARAEAEAHEKVGASS